MSDETRVEQPWHKARKAWAKAGPLEVDSCSLPEAESTSSGAGTDGALPLPSVGEAPLSDLRLRVIAEELGKLVDALADADPLAFIGAQRIIVDHLRSLHAFARNDKRFHGPVPEPQSMKAPDPPALKVVR